MLTNAHFVIQSLKHYTSQLHTTHFTISKAMGSHLALFFLPILAKTSISSILHGTDGRQLNWRVAYIYTHYTRATVSTTRGFLGGKRAIRSQRIVRATAPSSLDELLQHSIQKLVLLCTFFQPSFLCQTAWSFYVFQRSFNRAVDFSWAFFLNFSWNQRVNL